MPSLHHKEDVTVQLKVDPYFTGIMRGLANDEAEGCELKGECVVRVHHRPVKARRIVVWFEGRSKVNLQGALGVASSETVESRSLIFKDKHFLGDDGQVKVLEPGTYVYPFSFELPATLPASFRGKYGRIRYRLQATFHRPQMFSSDIHTSTDIVLRRSLPLMHMDNEEVRTGSNQNVHYTASAPSIAYREGGLVRLNLNINLEHPEYQSVRSVTCALREVVKYRTTGERSSTCQSAAKSEELFPLGWSTFYPSQSPDYNPAAQHDYNAIFRLCPRVHGDTQTRLLQVTHAVVVNVMVDTNKPIGMSTESPHASDDESDDASINGDDDKPSVQQLETGAMPSPPAYNSNEVPPSYFSSLEQLPAVPAYPIEQH
ncbi:or S-antigen, N-terminal domain-domain-containing protein [Syncephalastrum racemosum]|uniref:Or S-antigen, N-terminal domain-domain-containing protein n=1 Tax=Syncephalastrum racemosum TaxID=13706 RepID=A0A1X2H6R6_SYNRA|nr:or S-antigen, N-terminal domain-domain-containing protein [Syncephalastrum racemosum]